MTDTNLEKLAHELADPKIFEGLSGDQIGALMEARLGHLDPTTPTWSCSMQRPSQENRLELS